MTGVALLERTPMNLRVHFERQRMQMDESCSVALVVGLGWVCFHSCDRWIVQAHRRFAAGDHDVAFVELQPHRAGDVLLAFRDESLQCKPFGVCKLAFIFLSIIIFKIFTIWSFELYKRASS